MRSRYGPLKRGDKREDGKIFFQYEPRETKSKGRVGYERWVSLKTYRKEQERQRTISNTDKKYLCFIDFIFGKFLFYLFR